MGYIPEDAKWHIVDIIVEIKIENEPRNVVQTNIVLIRADSPEEAYAKAIELGKEEEASYKNSLCTGQKMAKIVRRRKFSVVGGFRVGAEKVPFSAPPGMTGCLFVLYSGNRDKMTSPICSTRIDKPECLPDLSNPDTGAVVEKFRARANRPENLIIE